MKFDLGMFTADSETIKAHILGLPITEEPITTEFPSGFEDAVDISELGLAATSGESGIIPRLHKIIKRWPTVPALKNFLEVAYRGQGKFKKAAEVSKLIIDQHPDYLFGRLSMVRILLQNFKLSEARQLFGENLDVMALIPGRTEVHLSEVKSYYSAAAKLYAMEGRRDKAVGILSALEELLPDTDPAVEYVNEAIIVANMEDWRRKFQADEKRKIKVNEAPIIVPREYPTRPSLHHLEIQAIYEKDFAMTREQIQSILDLPYQTRVADLCLVLRHSTSTAAFIWKQALWENGETDTALQVLHFLAASEANEVLPDALRFLELHSDLLQMYFGENIYPDVFAQLIGDQSAVVFAWLRKPGVGSVARETMVQALIDNAEESPSARAEYIPACEELLEFYLASSLRDNVIDTGIISQLVGSLINLRSLSSSDLIQRLWHKNYILEVYVGDLDIMLSDLHSADNHSKPPRKPFDIHSSYQTYENDIEEEGVEDWYEEENFPRLDYPGTSLGPSLPFQSLKPNEPGRNDPCTCGSGKKYKKCCLRS